MDKSIVKLTKEKGIQVNLVSLPPLFEDGVSGRERARLQQDAEGGRKEYGHRDDPSGKSEKDEAGKTSRREEKEEPRKEGGCTLSMVACYLKTGDHSIKGEGAIEQPREILSPSVKSNAISALANRLYMDMQTRAVEQATILRISSKVMGSNTYGGNRNQLVSTDLHLLRVPNDGMLLVHGMDTRSVDTLQLANANPFLLDSGNILIITITGRLHIPLDAARAMAPFLLSTPERVDMLGLYTKGWCLALLMAVVEGRRAAGQPQPTNWMPFDANWANILWGAADFPETFGTALTSRRILVLERDFTALQIRCLAHIARAGAPLAAQGVGELQPRVAAITWPGISFTIFSVAAVDPLAPADFTSAMMVGTLTQLAATRGERADLARGMYRAAVIFAQSHNQLLGVAVPEWYLPTAERAIQTMVPASVDSNALWRWLGLAHERPDASLFVEEAATASSLSGAMLIRVAGTLGSVFGVGEALAFHSMNIGGADLNAFAGLANAGGVALTNALNEVLRVPGDGSSDVAFIHELACAELVQTTQMVFQASALVGANWNDGNQELGEVLADNNWQGRWGHRVPYCADPLSVTKYLHYWPANWGIFKGDVTLNVASEVVAHGATAGWYADRGNAGYRALTVQGACDTPCMFLPYGTFMMNAFTQFSGVGPFPFTYRVWARGYGGPEMPTGVRQAPPMESGDFYPDLGVMKPGFVLSYDWCADIILAPTIAEVDFGMLWPTVCFDRFVGLDNIGLLLQGALAPPNTRLGSMSIRSAYKRPGRSSGPATTNQPEEETEAPEN